MWHSANGPRPPADALGLIAFSILVPSVSDVDALLRRLQNAGAAVKSDAMDALRTADPDGNFIELGVK